MGIFFFPACSHLKSWTKCLGSYKITLCKFSLTVDFSFLHTELWGNYICQGDFKKHVFWNGLFWMQEKHIWEVKSSAALGTDASEIALISRITCREMSSYAMCCDRLFSNATGHSHGWILPTRNRRTLAAHQNVTALNSALGFDVTGLKCICAKHKSVIYSTICLLLKYTHSTMSYVTLN